MERLTVKVYDRKQGKVLEVAPGIRKGMLRHYPKRYTLDIPKNAQPVLNNETEEVIHVEEEEKKELLKDEMTYSDVEEVKEESTNFEGMNLGELRAYAKDKGMKGTTRKNREQLMGFINNL